MKANLKGLGGIKGLFLRHGEKLLILTVGICTLLFVYYSMRLDRLDDRYQADKLRQEITQTDSVVKDFNWEKAVAEHPDEVRVVKKLDKEAAQVVDSGDYPIGRFDPQIIKATVLRTDPALLAAVEPRATGGSGVLPFIDEKVMKERQLKRAAEEEQKAKEEAEKLEREQQQQQDGEGPGQRDRDRGRGRGEEGMDYAYDPEHPNRRPVEGVGHAPGALVMGDERIERAFWAIVVAKVPIKEQLKLYRDAFENTRGGFDPQYDFPRYAGYVVQRAEVRPGQELQWARVDVYDGQGNKIGPFIARPFVFGPTGQKNVEPLMEVAATKWAAQMPEPVDPRYLDTEGLLAFPLPPLLGRDWGPEVTHPDIPLAINAPPMEQEVAPELEAPVAAPTNEEDNFSRPLDPTMSSVRRPGGEGMPGRGYGRSVFRGGEDEGGGRSSYGRAMMGRRSMRGDGEGGGPGYFRGGEGGATAGVLPKGVDSWLLRFIDFSVEPGKKYKYRVQLVLDDPNNIVNNPELLLNTLDSAVRNRLKAAGKGRPGNKAPTIRYAEWSEPTPTVGIPLAGSVRLAAAKVPIGKAFNEEPSATLLVESFDLDEEGNAIHAANEKELRRGYVANMVEDTEYVLPDGRSIDEKKSFKFFTGIAVVDVAGGEKLTRDMESPSRVLLLDPSGELYIRNELDDAEAVILHKTLFAKPKKNRDGEMPMGRGGEGGFMRGGRGGRGE